LSLVVRLCLFYIDCIFYMSLFYEQINDDDDDDFNGQFYGLWIIFGLLVFSALLFDFCLIFNVTNVIGSK